MTASDPEIYRWLSDQKEHQILDAKSSVEKVKGILSRAGIKPNLETVLAYWAGIHVGAMWVDSIYKRGEPDRFDFEGIHEDLRDDASIMRREYLKQYVEFTKEE